MNPRLVEEFPNTMMTHCILLTLNYFVPGHFLQSLSKNHLASHLVTICRFYGLHGNMPATSRHNSFRATRWKSKDQNMQTHGNTLTGRDLSTWRSRSLHLGDAEIWVIFLPALCFEKIKWIIRLSLKWALRSVSSRIHGESPLSGGLQWETAANSTICAQVVSRVVHDAAAWWLHHGAADPDHCSNIYFGECAFRVGAGIRCTKCCFGWSTG